MTIFDRIILLLTGLTAIYLVWRFIQDNGKGEGKKMYNTYYIISFAVLLVAGLLLILKTYSILSNQWVVLVSYLIPLGLSLGLVSEFHKDKEKAYMIFGIIGIVAIFVTRILMEPSTLGTLALIIFHTTAGIIIVTVPILATKANKAPGGFILVSVGGVLIDLGGVALAFLKSGSQLLFFSSDFVFTILAPLLLLMALAYTWGFVKKMLA